jgi:hypothetical protein
MGIRNPNRRPADGEDRGVADAGHPSRRRLTRRYRRKRDIVKNIWIWTGLVMLAHGSPAFIVALGLGTTFLAFMILDETP